MRPARTPHPGRAIARAHGRSTSLEHRFNPDQATGGLPMAVLRNFGGGGISVSPSAIQYFDLDYGGATAIFGTTHPSIFTNGTTSAITGSPLHGIQIAAAGSYKIEVDAFASGGTTGKTLIVYRTDAGASTGYLSNMQFGRAGGKVGDGWDANSARLHLSFFEYLGIPDISAGPLTSVLWAQLQSGSSAVTVNVEMVITQISPVGLSAF